MTTAKRNSTTKPISKSDIPKASKAVRRIVS